jgi:ATP-dependent DNA helicase RecG
MLARLSSVASTEHLRVGAAQFDLVDYPEDVARELIANAFAHRDWDAAGVIEVNHSPDELVISSPGGLLPTMHLDRLLRETAPRNRLLASEIARLHIAEGAGLGFDRVWRGLASLGKPPPRLAADTHFSVTVPGGQGDSSFVRYLHGPSFPSELAADLDVLLILSMLRNEKSVSAETVAGAIQRDVDTSRAVLRRMEESGLLTPTVRTARRASPTYQLAAEPKAALRRALAYRVGNSIDEDDAKLIRHLRRHRSITNEDVRDYLDCDVATARNRLTRMRNKGWIDFAPGSAKRGPAVTYVPTPTLDKVDLNQ